MHFDWIFANVLDNGPKVLDLCLLMAVSGKKINLYSCRPPDSAFLQYVFLIFFTAEWMSYLQFWWPERVKYVLSDGLLLYP